MSGAAKIRAVVFGTGKVGREVIKGCLAADDLELVGGVVTDPAKEGRDLGELAGLKPAGPKATTDLESVLGRDDVDLVFYCGLGNPQEVAERLGQIAESGKDAITVTGMVHPESALGQEGARRLAERAAKGKARIVGAGWNPGFLLDVLPVLWGASCVRLDRVFAQRVAEMRDWGTGVLDEDGIGAAPDQVRPESNSNPLHESVALIADGLHLRLDQVKNEFEPYVSTIRREHKGRVVLPGQNAGFHKRSLGMRGDKTVIEVEMIGIFAIDPRVDQAEEGARIRIEGDATVETQAGGDWFGDSYPVTAARAIRAAGPLRTLPPGLYRPDQLPLAGDRAAWS
jgi:2,4-diaminopentanoate dehydrogenase